MSFNLYAYEQIAHRAKNQRIVMKKERFRKQDKTKKCSFCKYASIKTVHLGKEIRRLCPSCLVKWNNHNIPVPVKFERASEI